MLVMFAFVPLDKEVGPAVDVTYSPTLPAFALSFVVVPMMPAVEDGVIVLVAWSVVNLPAPGVVAPIAGGDAR